MTETNRNQATKYFDEIIEIHYDDTISIKLKYPELRKILEDSCKDLTKEEALQFSNLFSRLSFICDKYNLNQKKTRQVHAFRVTANKVLHEKFEPVETQYLTHVKALTEAISHFYKTEVPEELKAIYPTKEYYERKAKATDTWIPKLRVELKQKEGPKLFCHSEHAEDELIEVRIEDPALNDRYTRINEFWEGAQLFLLNNRVDENGVFFPMHIILEPDYLLDVTSIAECFHEWGASELNYLKSKFEHVPNSKPILLGNFANYVIDALFSEKQDNPEIFLNEARNEGLLIDHFKANPFEYTTCTEIQEQADFQNYIQRANLHYENLRRVFENEFPNYSININNSVLEPSFLVPQYGIQGRLDILDDSQKIKIVELKSGSTVFPDDGESIKPNHKAQLFLYYQIIHVVKDIPFKNIGSKIDGFILYSKLPENNLRREEATGKQVQDILNLRNHILVNEQKLANGNTEEAERLFSEINEENIAPNGPPPFIPPQINKFRESISKISEIEKYYFYSFVNFIAKEQYLAKIGEGQYDSNNGLANLWLNSFTEKQDRFEILYDLRIVENKVCQEEKLIKFERENPNNKFVNFREGDICVLYPKNSEDEDVTTNQIFKCTISRLSKDMVEVRFRYQQRNTDFFKYHTYWAIERDFLDSSFISMYRELYSFITAPSSSKKKLLCQIEPEIGDDYGFNNSDLTEEANRVINKALTAKDYFLLVGPPGTGKTSIVLKELVKELHEKSQKNLLLLAYTNRAVDEICDAIKSFSDDIFIRVGSELSCAERHRNNLLDEISSKANSREELRNLLQNYRIYVSTVSSIVNKPSIFNLKEFDVTIVDEASQILEPQIIGLLAKSKKFIMVGDHKQLPAIVLQRPENSKTKNSELENIGLNDRKNSLFERLYETCKQKGWNEFYDELTVQGRMHYDIALFPNYSFYESSLKEALPWQKEQLNLSPKKKYSQEDLLSQKRLVFIPSKVDPENHFGKSNNLEADLVVRLISKIKELYSRNGKGFEENKTVGVITPYRNQIALIKQKLEEAEIPNFENITVDTVERFQGSQRDVILLSFSVNTPYELDSLINPSDDGLVDRKLNVALTRAKEHLVLIGNDSILSGNMLYFRLVEFIKSKGGYVDDSIENVLNDKFSFEYFDSDESVEGKTYTPDNEFKDTFDSLVIDSIKNDNRTEWPNKILGETSDFLRNNVIEYGRTDFDSKNLLAQNFEPKDKVNLYCFFNMRKHYFSSLSIYESYSEFFTQEINRVSGRATFIDFGCGPMTSGLAFKHCIKNYLTHFNYFGIDISDQMLKKAHEFFETSLSDRQNKIILKQSFNQLNEDHLADIFNLPNLVILNFSYFFSNLTLAQSYELAREVENMVEKFPLNTYVLVYQNPASDKRHLNFSKFKNRLKSFPNRVVRKTETVSYKNNIQSHYDKSERFTYEILKSQ